MKKKKKNGKRKTIKKIKKRKLKKTFYLSYGMRVAFCVIMFIISLSIGVFFLIKAMDITSEENIAIYENGQVNYKVCLKKNDFYDKECLNKDMTYVASLIKNIPVNFSYNFSTNSEIEPLIKYEVVADLVIRSDDSNTNYYNKSYTLVDSSANVESNNGIYKVNKDINIDYNYYNDIANKFKKQYGVSADSYLDVNLLVYVDEFNKTSKLSIRIPLSLKALNIKLDTSDISQVQSKNITKKSFTIVNTIKLVCGVILIIFAIIYLCNILHMLRVVKIKKSKYEKELNKILNEYDRLVVKTTSLPKFSLYNVMEIPSFTELLDVRDNLGLPIMYYNVVKNHKAYFYIIHHDNLYLYTIKAARVNGE